MSEEAIMELKRTLHDSRPTAVHIGGHLRWTQDGKPTVRHEQSRR